MLKYLIKRSSHFVSRRTSTLLSKSLEPEKSKKLSEFLDKPSKPGKPVVVDYDEKSVELEWEASASDGGAQITHYIIQKKLRADDTWENCGIHDTPTGTEPLRATVEGLKQKQKLQFRVIAVNKAGESPPSDPSDMHTVKHRKRMVLD